MQSMISATFLHEAATYNGYIYTNENGEETYFKESNNGVCNSTYDQCYNLYESINDSETLYDPEKRTLTQGDDIYLFDISGRLVSITDKFKNTMSIAYENDRIVTVTDGIGRSFAFSYSGDGYLTKISAPDNTYISCEYSDGLLTNITYPDKQKAIIAYAANKPSSVTLQNADCENIYNVEYVFNGDNVVSVTEFGAEAGTFVAGATSEYIYSAASGRTMVVTTEQADEDDSEVNVTKTVYTFDDQGEVVSEYLYSEEGENKGVSGSSVGINPTSGESGMKVADNSNNFLQGHNFENYWHWYSKSNNGKQPTVNYYTDETNAKYGRRLLKLQSSSSAATEIGVCQTTTILTERDYTFSAYVRVVDAFSGTEDPGVYIRVLAEDGTILAESEHICQESSEYVRLISSFKLESEQAVVVQILLDGVGTAYVNAPQLESNPYAGAYNMLINGGCEYDNEGWYGNGMYTATDVGFSTKRAIGIQGYLNVACYADQEVKAKTARSTRETFTLSGWAKGRSLPVHDRDGVSKPTFRLRARIKYYDSYYRDYYSYEDFTADFSPCTEDWQFASVEFSKSKYRTIQSITVYCDYGYNDGSAYFDDIQLVRTGIETGLSSSDFTDDVSESDYDDSSTGSDNTAAEFEEVVDTFGNPLTETTFTDGEFGTLYRAFDFSENGNNLVSETDVNGNKTLYSVNEITSRNEEITDRLGNKTVYEYDENGNTVKLTSKDANDKDLATVAYEYDSFNNITKIARGDGMDYVLKYNAFHNLKSIGIEGKAENLVTYAYKNGNGKLKEVTYANGDTMKASYNSLGQMTAEKWYDKYGALTAHYKYVYDGQGNIVRSVDILAKKEYTYVYEDGKISRATEYDVTVNENEIITAKTVVNTIYYTYSEDKLTKKRIVPSQGDELVTYFENSDDDNTVVKFTAGGKNVTSHSKNDSFGRKVFDELQLSTGFVSRQFSYHAGEVSETHTENEKLKSSATTQLVSQIVMSDGRTIAYEYDAEERITKVVDSIEGTTEYTYDALGQLLTETTNGTAVNNMVYDSYGNILQKNGKQYVYDEVWKDRLAYYDGKPLTYDAQGNPTNYLGHTLTWEKGRQLKSFGNISYTYNANGIRTSKTVDGIRHDYLLDGAKILKETWNDDVLEMLYDNEDSVCGIIYNGTPYYFLKNLQGDIIAITNAKGETVARYSYDAWGICNILETESVNGSIANINPFRYRGYYYDEETELYYLQSRYYNPIIGRFVNGDSVEFAVALFEYDNNLYTYCNNAPVYDIDSDGFKSYKTKNKNINKILSKIEKYIPNIYSSDFKSKEKTIFKIGTKNLSLTFSVGASVQSNKNALFGAMFKKGTLEVSSYLGINNYACFAFSAGINWIKAYLKAGIFIALSKGPSGLCIGFCIQINIPTWLLAVATVAVAVVSVYAPAIAMYIAKTLATIRSSIRVATPVLVPLVTNYALKLA